LEFDCICTNNANVLHPKIIKPSDKAGFNFMNYVLYMPYTKFYNFSTQLLSTCTYELN